MGTPDAAQATPTKVDSTIGFKITWRASFPGAETDPPERWGSSSCISTAAGNMITATNTVAIAAGATAEAP